MMRILVSDRIADKGIEKLRSIQRFSVDVMPDISHEELMRRIGDYDALVVRSRTRVTREVIEAGSNLKVIGRAGVGVDNIDVDAATSRGIIVLNAPEGNTISAAEHTIAMMMALARNIPQAHQALKSRIWKREAFMGTELYDKTLGLIGLGRIGREVAKRASAMHMRVVAYDPFLAPESGEGIGVALSSLSDVLSGADFLTIHCPLTRETRHLIGDREFAMMKDGVRLVNCARGGIVDEEALYKAILSGKVAGAALDVFEEEPPLKSPLLDLDCVIVTPHLGASTEEAQVNVAVNIAEQVAHALLGEPFRNAVNVPFIRPEAMAAVKPYMPLAEKLGRLATQLCGAGIRTLRVTYGGAIAEHDTRPLTATLLKGLLSPIMTIDVNFVNAPFLSRERGIKVVEAKDMAVEDFTSLITVEVTTDGKSTTVAGTLFGTNDPRIVRIDEYHVDAIASGHLLVIPHIDKPGVIGPVGMVLGRNGINIASMHVGRKDIGGRALMLLGVDSPVPQHVLREILNVDGVADVKPVEL